MTKTFEIPLSAKSEVFSVTMGGADYTLRVNWCIPMGRWILDILTGDASKEILTGLPLSPGVDLLKQYAHLGILGELVAQVDHDVNAAPSFENLGTTGHLFYITP